MTIAFLTPEYPHPKTGNFGGIGTSIKNLAKGLLALGCPVRVLVYGQKQDGVFFDEGICIQQIKNVKIKGLSWYLTRKKIEAIVNQLYNDQEIDIVEAPDWTGITSFIQPKQCPIVIRLNGSDTYFCHLDQRPVKWQNTFHEKRALKKADGLIAVSQFTANKTNELFGLKKQFAIIPNSIDMNFFKRGGSMLATSNTILYFGSLIRKKGLLELPLIFNEVVKTNPNAKLVLVGRDVPDVTTRTDSTWDMMHDLFSEQALQRVSYFGSVSYDNVQQYIGEATVCVFPSFAEALPVSWLEAMAMEKSIVASNIGWAPEVIDDGKEGYLVHPTMHEQFAKRIVDLLDEPYKRNQFGMAARDKVIKKFSMEVVAKQSLEFYQSLQQDRC